MLGFFKWFLYYLLNHSPTWNSFLLLYDLFFELPSYFLQAYAIHLFSYFSNPLFHLKQSFQFHSRNVSFKLRVRKVGNMFNLKLSPLVSKWDICNFTELRYYQNATLTQAMNLKLSFLLCSEKCPVYISPKFDVT